MILYKTKEECESAIKTLRDLGYEVPQNILDQYKAFCDKDKSLKNSSTPIYDKLVAEYPYGEMPLEKKDCIEGTVKQLLEEGENAEEPGLLLGKIQCGKTDTFEDIIGLAFDKGIDITIVFTKGTKPLAQQTLKRMKNDYRFFKASDDLEQKATINIYDIMDVWSNLKQANIDRGKTIFICKKETTNLKHLIEMFTLKSPFLKDKKVLIVDDEADFASRNYIKAKSAGKDSIYNVNIEMAKISQQIDEFRKIPKFCRYLQVTATPYCLYLQPQGELNLCGNIVKPFRPRFTTLVPIHAKYIGGDEYFVEAKNVDSMYYHLHHPISKKCIDIMGHEDKRYLNAEVSSPNIYDLTYALISYFVATAIRRIQERKKVKDFKTSALFHVDISKQDHEWQEKLIKRLIDSLKKTFIEHDTKDYRIMNAFADNIDDFKESIRKGKKAGLINVEMPFKEEIEAEIKNILEQNNYHIQVVNSDQSLVTLLNEETGELSLDNAVNIFIGGNVLDRGVTIKNMLCFFYGRDPKTFQQDTVLQHARMYGARSKEDMAVTRFHTTDSIYQILRRMNELDSQLRDWFIKGKDQNDLNAVFVGYDKNIKPCAAQKIKASNTLTLKGHTVVLPSGFWTGSNTNIKKTIAKIDNLVETCPNYNKKDANGFIEMEKDTVKEILNLIESTYVFDDIHHNLEHKDDIKEILCALEYCASKSDGKVYVVQKLDREMSRLRANGGYIDAPADGHSDLPDARAKAINVPVLILTKQKGKKEEKEIGNNTKINIGWNDAPFYWPIFISQKNIEPVMFSFDQDKAKK